MRTVRTPRTLDRPTPPGPTRPPRWPRRAAAVAGSTMVAGAAVNTALVVTRPELYADLGTWLVEASPWPTAAAVDLWGATIGEHPRLMVPLVGVGFELAVGLLALSPAPRRRLVGLAGIAVFHTGLLAMGAWPWAAPVLAGLVPVTAATARAAAREGRS